MVKNNVEEYKKAVKRKYEMEKTGTYSSFLLNPSRARLRNLCAALFMHNTHSDDLKSFSVFFQFDYVPNASNKLKEQTDKFRPIETFFKGETDLVDVEAVNLAAILVDFHPRPFLKFSRLEPVIEQDDLNKKKEPDAPLAFKEATTLVYKKGSGMDNQSLLPRKKAGLFQNRLLLPLLLGIIIVGGFGYMLVPKKECMQWQNDHYEAVVCESKSEGFLDLYTTLPINKELLHFRKIQVCDTTLFFRNNRPIVWYSKNKKKLEFFNGPGFNPENGKPLKPITDYMIDKYVKEPH